TSHNRRRARFLRGGAGPCTPKNQLFVIGFRTSGRGRQSTIRRPLSVAGKQDRHLGPRWEYAEIELVAEPADAWDVQVSLPEEDRVEMERDHSDRVEGDGSSIHVRVQSPSLPHGRTKR